jgi:hypothetical protein
MQAQAQALLDRHLSLIEECRTELARLGNIPLPLLLHCQLTPALCSEGKALVEEILAHCTTMRQRDRRILEIDGEMHVLEGRLELAGSFESRVIMSGRMVNRGSRELAGFWATTNTSIPNVSVRAIPPRQE